MTPSSDHSDCKHEYRLFNDIRGEWKLIWECRKCGFLCICKCFKKAIENMDVAKGKIEFSPEHDIEALCRLKKISPEELQELIRDIPYAGMVCEICRDAPSTHTYAEDMVTMKEFQRRYGAYVVKQAIELIAGGLECADEAEYLRYADELIRDMYGFRPDAETGIDDEQLFKIIKQLYPHDEVIHHYRPDWLTGDDLEVYIPKLNLAIEYRGIEHYEVIETNGGRSSLRDNVAQDLQKEEYCKQNGIDLLVFPYFKELDCDGVGWKIAEVIRSRE